MSKMFIVRFKLLKAILEDKEWRKKFEDCKTTEEKQKVVAEYCEKHGWQVVEY